LLAAKFYKRYK